MTNEFFGKSFGILGKFFRWLGIAGALIGILLLLFSPANRGTGIQMFVAGTVVAAVTGVNKKNPLVVLSENDFSIRLGTSKKYQTIPKDGIERIDIAEKSFVIVPKQGRNIKITKRMFSADTWARLREEMKVFMR